MEEMQIYTIDDVARELGVSKTTVSRALSGKGRISEETTRRVKEFVEKHNFSPNVMARGLAQSKTYNLALLMPMDFGENEIAFFKECMSGIVKVAAQNNYDVMISFMDSQLDRMISNHKIDGVLLTRSLVSAQTQKFLKQRNIPFVVVGSGHEEGVHYIDNDNRSGSRELTKTLIEQGFNRIALLGGDESYEVTVSRKSGFFDAFKESGLGIDDSYVYMGVDSYISASSAVNMAMENNVDCIVCMDDYVCNLVLEILHEKGIRIPDDVSIASLYDSSRLEHYVPSITSLHFSTKALGRRSAALMLRLLGEDVDEDAEVLKYRIENRESTKK